MHHNDERNLSISKLKEKEKKGFDMNFNDLCDPPSLIEKSNVKMNDWNDMDLGDQRDNI